MSTTPRLEVRGVSKTYGAVTALDRVALDVRPGEVHALLGHNGAGKSTMVKVLAGVVRPDAGTVLVDGEEVAPRNPRQARAAGIALVDQELSLVGSLTVEENLALGAPRGSVPDAARLRDVLDRLGLAHVGLRAPVARLTLGEQQLVEIARALSRDARVLILDEPTATLSDAEIAMVFTAVRGMAAEGRSVIYVSHRLGEVLELCQRATVFRDGRAVGTRDVAELDRDSIVEMMLGHVPAGTERPARADDGAAPALRVTGLSVPPRLAGLDLEVRPGEIVGLAGQIGCGASEVLRALAGLEPEAEGRVEVAGRTLRPGRPLRSAAGGVRYTTADRKSDGLFLGHSIARNIVATRLPGCGTAGVLRPAAERRQLAALLELTGIPAARRRLPVGSLSGGNQQKVLVARSLQLEPCHLLLLDEPTRGVDVGGRADIHALVRRAADAGAAVVFASTELDEVLELSDTVVTMFGGRVVARHPRAGLSAARVLADTTHGAPGAAPTPREAVTVA
ncbi:sugar ABC transporter ATP-binding protein [Nocardioides lentus]|uniref:Sugar ABC transporter ATP-binding protein n=1 Tax=Nocardioides lentus TaxID=338077 RepID=A0ABP5A709_9ACTN